MSMDRKEIAEKVQEILVDALGVDDDEVTEDATLMGDLGAESIDFLEIVFHLEKAFDIKVPREELFPAELASNEAYVSGGKLTAAGIDKLKTSMPHLVLGDFEKNPDVNKMSDLFTVGSVINFVAGKVK